MPLLLSSDPVSDQQLVDASSKAVAAKRGTTILQLASGIAWRQYLKPAMFRSARFHVDTGVRESGRRVVNHEFPKRDVPYAEDMGRRARELTVRGYIVVYPNDGSEVLQKKNYIPARDALITALESTDGPADLQLPLLGVVNAMCTRYRITEEDRFGGYCVFDMTFTEFGQAPATGTRDSAGGVTYAAQNLGDATQSGITSGIKAIGDGAVTSA